jgi:hypothetical protein
MEVPKNKPNHKMSSDEKQASVAMVLSPKESKTDGLSSLQVDTSMLDPKVLKLYEIGKVFAAGTEITAASIITFCTTLITAVQELVQEKGQGKRKKEMVLSVLRLVITNDVSSLSTDDKATILAILDTTVPVFIDTAIGIATGEIDLQKEWNQVFGGCCPCGPAIKRK